MAEPQAQVAALIAQVREYYLLQGAGLYGKAESLLDRINRHTAEMADESLLELLRHPDKVARMAGCIGLFGRRDEDITEALAELGSGEPLPWTEDPIEGPRRGAINEMRSYAFMMLVTIRGGLKR